MAAKIFFCYAREDEPLLNELKYHLEALRRQGLIETWYDRDISAGTEWEKEIDKRLDTAQIILLLVSQYFMASDYCYGIEMKKAMQQHKQGEAVVIPIILRPVYFQGAPFGKLQALPSDAKPVKSWPNQDEAYFDIAEGIRKAVQELATKPFSSYNTNRPLYTPPSNLELMQPLSNLDQQPAYLADQTHEDSAGRHDEVVKELQPSQKTAEDWLQEGESNLNSKHYKEALIAFEQAIQLNPNDALAYNNKGRALSRLKRYEEAILAYERALQLNPKYAHAYNNKGVALKNLGFNEEAVLAYEEAIRLNPNYALAYKNMGYALNILKRYEEANTALARAKLLD